MNRIILDTETTSLDKPFAYDVGYQIIDEEFNVLCQRSFVIEQVWHNLPLFESAYYKEKRPLYVAAMRAKKATLTKWGYAMSQMIRDIKNYNIVACYAFNSNFDDKVLNFNCDWFKTRNPLDTIPVYDIWGYSSEFITKNNDYRLFAETNQCFTDSGNYSGNAENVYKFLTQDLEFVESHTGLKDVEIETAILRECIARGAQWNTEYKVNKILARQTFTPYTIKVNGDIVHEGSYIKKYVRNGVYSFTE